VRARARGSGACPGRTESCVHVQSSRSERCAVVVAPSVQRRRRTAASFAASCSLCAAAAGAACRDRSFFPPHPPRTRPAAVRPQATPVCRTSAAASAVGGAAAAAGGLVTTSQARPCAHCAPPQPGFPRCALASSLGRQLWCHVTGASRCSPGERRHPPPPALQRPRPLCCSAGIPDAGLARHLLALFSPSPGCAFVVRLIA